MIQRAFIPFFFCLSFLTGPAIAWETLTDNLYAKCNQTEARLECEYRLLIPEPPLDITATAGNEPLSIEDRNLYPWPGSITAILFLVDTSDPARQIVIENNIRHINELLQATASYHRVGLASFDKNLRIEAPIGSGHDRIRDAAATLKAVGKTTELYRNTIKAIDVLDNIEADRKSIFLFSDGLAEDKAYYHEDVVRAARDADVIINSFGYPRSASLSVALQTLRRLSEETGGIYIEANNRYQLPGSFNRLPFENIDNGGRFSLDIEPLLTGAPANPAVALNFATDIGDITARVPVDLPRPSQAAPVAGPAPAPPPAATAGGGAVQQPAYQIVSPATEPEEINLWLWYGTPIILAIVLVLVVIILVVVFQQKTDSRHTSRGVTPGEFKPFAYLVVQDEKKTRYPISSTIWRIGRTRDNELTFEDNSVSRRHAEIHRYTNGNFVIFDVESLNGIYVNEEKVKKKKLQEGDIIEIGDIFLRFTLYSDEYHLDEDTAMQHTKSPAVTG